MSFVHLHRHSDFSLLDGVGSNAKYAEVADRLGQEALAITDHGSMAGVLYHIQACEQYGIKPIVGMEAYFKDDATIHSVENKSYSHLVLLAKNAEGFKTLLRLTSESNDEDHFYYKPCVDWKLLEKHHEGLIASSSCVSGMPPKMLLQGQDPSEYLGRMQTLFGDDFYLEIQPHDFDEQRKVNEHLLALAQLKGIPLVATVDAHYPEKDWDTTQDIMLMISTNSSLAKRKKSDEEGKEDYLKFSGHTFWLMSEEEVAQSFMVNHSGLDANAAMEAMKNTKLFADRCERYEVSKAPKIPKATRSPLEAELIIRTWVNEGLRRIGKEHDDVYLQRVEHELDVIRKNKVMDYFVIVGKGVRWAKDNGIRVGPGRGSAAGSLVCYLSRITGLDPIGYDLLFERFMNEYRSELPDIDLDFQHNRRDDVKDYYRREFGDEHVVDVCAFQTFGTKAAIQCVARVHDIPYEEFMHVTKTVQEHVSSTKLLDDFMTDGEHPDLEAFMTKYPHVLTHAKRLEGTMKAMSKHPAAIIVTDKPAHEYIPTMRGNDGKAITQWAERADFQVISSYGFLKIDVLSTDSLTAQQVAVESIRKRKGIDVDFEDLEQFPVIESPDAADPEVLKQFANAHPKNMGGIFQFTSFGITELLRDVAGEGGLVLDDLIACNTLYRPGTLTGKVHEEYVARKHGKDWELWHQDVEPFMARSFGLMIYQEQVMQTCQVLGGFDAGMSNLVLKALTKWHGSRGNKQKGAVQIQKFEEEFLDGCVAKGMTKGAAKAVWQQIIDLTKYVFNRSHSAGYALQAYQDGWLKKYHKLDFYCALLTCENDKVPTTMREARNNGISILPPDINESDAGFVISGNSIRFGLEAIKGVGQRALEEIVSKRPFEGVDDFDARIEKKRCNSRVRTALIDAGAFDFSGARSGPEWTDAVRSKCEKDLLGFSLTRKPDVVLFEELLAKYAPTEQQMDEWEDGSDVYIAGEIAQAPHEHTDKSGGKMAFLELSLNEQNYKSTVFSSLYRTVEHLLGVDSAVVIRGKWDPGRRTVVAEHVISAEALDRGLKDEARAS